MGKNAALLTLLFQPALLLVDFGHFQYNSVMLGMSVAWLDWERPDDRDRFYNSRCHEFHFRKRPSGSLLLYPQLGI